jgi:predicted heme/steroid binding protein
MKRKLIIPLASLPATAAFTPSTPHSTHLRQHPTTCHTRQNTNLQAIIEPAIPLTLATAAIGTYYWIATSDSRKKHSQYAEYQSQQRELQIQRDKLAYIEPKPVWTLDELSQYDGKDDESGPILLAVKGDVFNVYKGRNFYGPGGEYHIMAGRDATRFLAKNRLEEESEEELGVDLNVGERANLEVSVLGIYAAVSCLQKM